MLDTYRGVSWAFTKVGKKLFLAQNPRGEVLFQVLATVEKGGDWLNGRGFDKNAGEFFPYWGGQCGDRDPEGSNEWNGE